MGSTRRFARWAAIPLVAAGLLLMSGVWPASAAGVVTAVDGSAYGYRAFNINLANNPQPDTGPTPSVAVAADASNSPQSGSATTALVTYGPAVLLTGDASAVQASGSLGASGSVTASSSLTDINKAKTQPSSTGSEVLTADSMSSSCTASASAAAAGSATVTNGTLVQSTGATPTAIPTNPAPNYTLTGSITLSATDTETFTYVFNEQTTDASGNLTVHAVDEYLHGPTAKGNVIIGQSVCGVTTVPQTDLSLQNPPISHSPNPVTGGQNVTFTITVANLGPGDAPGAMDSTTVSGGKIMSFTPSSGTCGMSKKLKGVLSCTFGTITSGTSATVQIVVATPRKAGSTVSVSSALSYPGDTNAANNTGSDSVTVQ